MDKFKNQKRWVNWRYETVDGNLTKVPYQVNGRKAKSNDPKTWSTFKEVSEKNSKNVGIMFDEDKTLLGIDLDHCLKNGKIEHPEKETIAEFILESQTYTEISPSQTGLHLYFEITEPFDPVPNKYTLPNGQNKEKYEFYTSARYFTVTEQLYNKITEIRKVTTEEMNRILSILGYPWAKTPMPHHDSQGEALDDGSVIRKMLKSPKAKAVYGGDTSDYGNDDSSADMALCMNLAFWTGKNAAQMERIWIASPIGNRTKTQARQDYRTRTINKAITKCENVYESHETKFKKENPNLDLLFSVNKNGDKIPVQNLENTCRIINKHEKFRNRFRFDEFKTVFELDGRQFKDSDALEIQSQIQILFPVFNKISKEMVYDAIMKVSIDNSHDSAKDWITSLVWDKTYRLDSWLHEVYGADDSELTHSIGSNWLKGLVHRLIEPGCKFDYVLVLEGDQGTKKSTSLNILGGGWHVETTMSTDSKDFFMQFAGKAIIEFSEGETLSRTEVKKMKAIITTQSDKFRPPYARNSMEFPRRCVFAMTTNQTEYLKDETGNRRWIPIRCRKVADIGWLKENRDQLFAEAYHRLVVKKETTYDFSEDALRIEQGLRRIVSPFEETIVDWYFCLTEAERLDGVTTTMAYQKGVQKDVDFKKEINPYESVLVGEILRSILKLEKRRIMVGGSRANRYYPTDATMTMLLGTPVVVDVMEEQFKNL